MKELKNINEIIQTVKTQKLIVRQTDDFSHCHSSHVFRGKFEDGTFYDVQVFDRQQICELKKAIQQNYNTQYAEFSEFKDFSKLKTDGRYTLLVQGDFGFVNATQLTFKCVNFGKYAQYNDAATLIFTPKHKRSLRQLWFYGNRSYILWEGWVTPDTAIYGSSEKKMIEGKTVSMSRSKYSAFDSGYFSDALKSVSVTPLLIRLP